jgi:hypothetical protein
VKKEGLPPLLYALLQEKLPTVRTLIDFGGILKLLLISSISGERHKKVSFRKRGEPLFLKIPLPLLKGKGSP